MVKIVSCPVAQILPLKHHQKCFYRFLREKLEKKWITAARRKDQVPLQSGLFCREDHFKVSLILKIKNLVVCNHCKNNFTE